LNMCRKVAACCELFNVRTAWHGPGNVSPIGHAINMHLDISSFAFGIQEQNLFSDTVREVFPGAPEIKGGYMYANDKPGLGIDINEKLAANFPYKPLEAAEAMTAGWMGPLFGRRQPGPEPMPDLLCFPQKLEGLNFNHKHLPP